VSRRGVLLRRRWSTPLVALIAVVVSLLAANAASGATGYAPATDPFSMANLTAQMGVAQWWDAGYTGQGVDVALIDTGVSPVPGLDGPGKVVYGPDLSLESQAPNLTNLDTNGHGTFMAGLIAGNDSTLTAPYSAAPASAYRGIAPDARIISLKVASADGGVDVSQVIAAIDWVVQHAHDPGFNIRVINLSYGTESTQPYAVDPLAYAVEQAWEHGIVVVAAAGNTGSTSQGLADPAYDPYVIAAGSVNTMGTSDIKDDVVATYSATSANCRGGCKDPDLVAPGSHIQGLRVPGSYIDLTHPEGIIDGRYFRGSGTSEAAAITSGVVALLLQEYPDLSPDEVKKLLTDSAQKVPGSDPHTQGHGEINLSQLAKKKDPNGPGPFCVGVYSGTASKDLEVPTGATCTLTASASIGHDLNVDQGGTLIDNGATIGNNLKADSPSQVDVNGGSIGNDVQVQNATGEVTITDATIGHDVQIKNNQGDVTVEGNTVSHNFHVENNAGNAVVDGNTIGGDFHVQNNGVPGAAGPGKKGSGPDGQNFPFSTGLGSLELSRGGDHISIDGVELTGNQDIFGNPFDLSSLATAEANGSSWSGGAWNGSTWSGSSWSGHSWSGHSWSGHSWSGSSWSGSTWSGNTWSGSSWSGSTWSGISWSGASWSGDAWSGDVWMSVDWG
jgi:Subtilase family